MLILSNSSAALESSLAAQWKRMGTIAGNIANEDTPGYKAKRISFEDSLSSELSKIQGMRLSGEERAKAYKDIMGLEAVEYNLENFEGRADGNNVDLINEQAELARVQIQYQALRQRVSSYYSSVQYAINGGRG